VSAAANPSEVIIRLGDQDVILKPSERAMTSLSRSYNGMIGVVEALSRFQVQAFVDVIAVGSNKPKAEQAQLPTQIYKAGILDLMPQLTRYVTLVSNGGRAPASEGSDADDSAARDLLKAAR
jgi:hypothetical protein